MRKGSKGSAVVGGGSGRDRGGREVECRVHGVSFGIGSTRIGGRECYENGGVWCSEKVHFSESGFDTGEGLSDVDRISNGDLQFGWIMGCAFWYFSSFVCFSGPQ